MQPIDQASNAELLSRLAGPGPAKILLERYGGLSALSRVPVEELRQLQGIGPARAEALRAAFLLSSRLKQEILRDSPLLDTPERVAEALREPNRMYSVEHFQVLCVNTRRRLIAIENVAKGLLDQVLVHPREVFSVAIARRASAIILAHNHPSGDPTPSEADIRTTRDMIRAGQLLKIEVLDHIVLGLPSEGRPRDYCSLRELGHFY